MNGILIINKPKNCTSHDIVYKVKKIVNEKVGHTGTLDPMATGVLPLLIGKGTLCSKYLINHDKIYEVVLQLGAKTETADSEGKIIESKEVPNIALKKENIENVFKSFLGEQEQIPPMYSAIKVKGKKLYEYARKGEKINIEPRKIKIYKISLTKILQQEKQICFRVECSKGTYIRSLCEDIAYKLGTLGYMAELKRIQVGEFNINNSITIEELSKNNINSKIIKIEEIFEKNESINLNFEKLQMFLNGVKLKTEFKNGIYKIYSNSKFIGTGIVNENKLKRDIIL